MLDWADIRSVFLDMDGTLLDLYYDNHFWREHVPRRYAERHGMDPDTAKERLFPRMRELEGTMDWYCVEFWSRELGLDITGLKHELGHLICVHPYVTEFLDAVRGSDRRIVLVTNAHRHSLDLKMDRTGLIGYFDAVICAHDLGLPKEVDGFWERLREVEPFTPQYTLLVDDNLAALRSARRFGIRHLVTVRQPDTRGAIREVDEFAAIHSFQELLPPSGGG